MTFAHLTNSEKELLSKWKKAKKTVTEMADLLGRSKSTVSRQLANLKRKKAKPVGRPPALDEKTIERLVGKAEARHCCCDFSL